ncbi:MAG: nuclear transport factor 2 family protein [Nannocystaceae bacterium]|nr:nuclear transport factor 2 family protein [Nannocystaceae bacterium]
MTNTHGIVSAFYASIENKDFDALRRVLHDNLDSEGPIDRLDSADNFVAALIKMSGLTEGVRIKHLFVDGERACCVLDVVTATPIGESPVAEYFELRDGRIAAIRSHFDSRPWFALFGSGAR